MASPHRGAAGGGACPSSCKSCRSAFRRLRHGSDGRVRSYEYASYLRSLDIGRNLQYIYAELHGRSGDKSARSAHVEGALRGLGPPVDPAGGRRHARAREDRGASITRRIWAPWRAGARPQNSTERTRLMLAKILQSPPGYLVDRSTGLPGPSSRSALPRARGGAARNGMGWGARGAADSSVDTRAGRERAARGCPARRIPPLPRAGSGANRPDSPDLVDRLLDGPPGPDAGH